MIPTCHGGDNICRDFALEVPMRKGVVLHAFCVGRMGGASAFVVSLWFAELKLFSFH